MIKMTRALALLSASALLTLGLVTAAGDRPAPLSASISHMEQIDFDAPTYVIVDQVEDAPMATGALTVEEVEFVQPLEVRIYRTVPGV